MFLALRAGLDSNNCFVCPAYFKEIARFRFEGLPVSDVVVLFVVV